MAKRKTFEEALTRLEQIVNDIEDGEIGLEQSVKLYKEGVELSVFCSEKLNTIEQEVSLLQKNADGVFSKKPFEIEE